MPTEKQLKFIDKLIAEKKISNLYLREMLGKFGARTVDDLSVKNAGALIEELMKMKTVKREAKTEKKEELKKFCFLVQGRTCNRHCIAYVGGEVTHCLILNELIRISKEVGK